MKKKKSWVFGGYFYKILSNMGQSIIFQMQIFNKHLNMTKYRNLGGNFYKIIKRTIWVKPYCMWYNFFRKPLNTKKYMSFRLKFLLGSWKDNGGQTVLPIDQNFLEILKKIQQQTICVFYKNWSIFSKTTLWVNTYCPWFKFFKRCLKRK